MVAADDGVMPQTLEAMDHAKAAGVPIVVAVNKIDKPDAQPDRVRQQLSDRGLMPEEWGGSTVFVNVSAKKKQNLEQLLEMLLLVADLQEVKANPTKPAVGTVLEARLDKGRGPVATVLVQDGTLTVGDTVVAGAVAGKIRALVDDRGARLKKAGPATPVEILGLPQLPEPGDQLLAVTDSLKAQSIVAFRQLKMREKALAASARVRLEDLSRAIAEGQLKELFIVLKADVQGSLEAVADQLNKLPQEKIKVRIIRQGVGAVTEGDVLLAAASNAVVIGFNVRPERKAAEIAERDEVELRLYTVIYDVAEEMKKAMEGLLEPTIREVRLGAAEVRDTFKISKVGMIAGCYVQDGKVTRTANVRLLRDNVVVHTGKVSSLKRFKDDASEVKSGLECGIGIANYNDVKPGDVIEFFTTEKVKETLSRSGGSGGREAPPVAGPVARDGARDEPATPRPSSASFERGALRPPRPPWAVQVQVGPQRNGHWPADARSSLPGGPLPEGQAAGAAQPGDAHPQPPQRVARRGGAPGPLAAGAARSGGGQHRPRAPRGHAERGGGRGGDGPRHPPRGPADGDPLMGRRPERLAEEIREEVARMIASEIKDPRLGFVTVIRVELAHDLRYARVHVGVLGNEAEREKSLTALRSAAGFVRRELGRRLRIHHTPEIDFRYDKGIEATDRVARLLAEEAARENPPDEGEGGGSGE